MSRKIIAGNWKMNKTADEADELFRSIRKGIPPLPEHLEAVVIPPFLYLQDLSYKVRETKAPVHLGAQHSHFENSGAYTGEISPSMLASLDIEYCITGHSERRELFGETGAMVEKKNKALLREGIVPIFCCGEPTEERDNKTHFRFVEDQLKVGLGTLTREEVEKTVIAYEPIWAIGTGNNATPEQIGEMHTRIRNVLEEKYGKGTADQVPLLYGGSCKPDNAERIFQAENVDGGLIGGASLKAADFIELIRIAERTLQTPSLSH